MDALPTTPAHIGHSTDTKSSPILRNAPSTMPGERLVSQSRVDLELAWIPRYAPDGMLFPALQLLSPFLRPQQDLFSQLFGGGGGFFGGGGPGRQSGPRRTKDLVHRVHVSLEDLYKGKTTKLALTRNVICVKCKGKGGKEGAVRTCGTCNGRGVKVTLRQMGPMIQQMQSACDECSGTGEIINAKDRCTNCKGKKVVPEKKILEVHVNKGMKGGQTVTFNGESDQTPGAEPGDVVIVIEEKPHDRFQRQDNDLITSVEIDLLTALGGGQFAIKHLDDRVLVVTLVPGEIIKDGKSDFTIHVQTSSLTMWQQAISRSSMAKVCLHSATTNPETSMSSLLSNSPNTSIPPSSITLKLSSLPGNPWKPSTVMSRRSSSLSPSTGGDQTSTTTVWTRTMTSRVCSAVTSNLVTV